MRIEQYLKGVVMLMAEHRADYKERGYRWPGVEAMLLDVGRQFIVNPPTKPRDVRWGKPRSCFSNAYHLAARRPDLTYCEGYAGRIIPAWHAWCCTEDGVVVDNTWRPHPHLPDSTDYWGVPLSLDAVHRCMLSSKVFGVLHNWESDFPLLKMAPEEFLQPLTRKKEN